MRKGLETNMQRISLGARCLHLRAMDLVCLLRGHRLTKFPKARYCRRCYRVEGIDFPCRRREPAGPAAPDGDISGKEAK